MVFVAILRPRPVGPRGLGVGATADADIGRVDLFLDERDSLVGDVLGVDGGCAVYICRLGGGIMGLVDLRGWCGHACQLALPGNARQSNAASSHQRRGGQLTGRGSGAAGTSAGFEAKGSVAIIRLSGQACAVRGAIMTLPRSPLQATAAEAGGPVDAQVA